MGQDALAHMTEMNRTLLSPSLPCEIFPPNDVGLTTTTIRRRTMERRPMEQAGLELVHRWKSAQGAQERSAMVRSPRGLRSTVRYQHDHVWSMVADKFMNFPRRDAVWRCWHPWHWAKVAECAFDAEEVKQLKSTVIEHLERLTCRGSLRTEHRCF